MFQKTKAQFVNTDMMFKMVTAMFGKTNTFFQKAKVQFVNTDMMF